MDRLKFWYRRFFVSLPFLAFFVNEGLNRRYDDGERFFHPVGIVALWLLIFYLGWKVAEVVVKEYRGESMIVNDCLSLTTVARRRYHATATNKRPREVK